MPNEKENRYVDRTVAEKILNKLLAGKVSDIQNDILELIAAKEFMNQVLQHHSYILEEKSLEMQDTLTKMEEKSLETQDTLTRIKDEIKKEKVSVNNRFEELGYTNKYFSEVAAHHAFELNQIKAECEEKDKAIYVLQKKIEYLTHGDESQPLKVIQIVQDLRYGDAIGNYVLESARFLRSQGITCEIYAEGIDERIEDKHVHMLNELPVLNKKDIMIIQIAAENRMLDLLDAFNCKIVICYHNITPPELLNGHGENAVSSARRGIAQLKKVASKIRYCIAMSEYNKRSLVEYGFEKERIRTIPLIINFEQYEKRAFEMMQNLREEKYWLTIGRVVPNKKIEDIIYAFEEYRKSFNHNVKLIIAGKYVGDDEYYQKLISIIRERDIRDVIFTGHISQEEINAYFANAELYICMSEHEGFCVPLVEAMYFGIPIIAYASSAIPETLGGVGVLLENKNPAIVAAFAEKIGQDVDYRNELIKKQNTRLQEFDCLKIQKQFYQYISEIMEDKNV